MELDFLGMQVLARSTALDGARVLRRWPQSRPKTHRSWKAPARPRSESCRSRPVLRTSKAALSFFRGTSGLTSRSAIHN
eukprot:14006302-Alexandrium_andersonii.AAC.1